MSTTLRVLGQQYPTANVEAVLYTCSNISTVISSFFACNTGSATDYISARICVANATDTNKQLLYSNLVINGNSLLELTAGLTLANSDAFKVTSQNGTTAFQLFGQENN